MKIGVISDTHDYFPGIEWAHEVLKAEAVEAICHCGDWVSPFTIEYFDQIFADFAAPVHGVFGNNEGDIMRFLERNAQLSRPIVFDKKDTQQIQFGDKTIVLYHGQNRLLLDALIASNLFNAVFTGHTHQYRNEMIGNTLVLNPGSLVPARSSKPSGEYSLAIYDSDTNTATQHRMTLSERNS